MTCDQLKQMLGDIPGDALVTVEAAVALVFRTETLNVRIDVPYPQREVGESVEALYQAYPRHVGRGQAMRAIRGALKKASFADIMAGVERYKLELEQNGTAPEFVAHPATWFNGERWMDEALPAAKSLAQLRAEADEANRKRREARAAKYSNDWMESVKDV